MPNEMIDVFCHWTPPKFARKAVALSKNPLHMLTRAIAMPVMSDLDARFRVMDRFPGYKQIPSHASPSPEAVGGPEVATEISRVGNDEMAEIVAKHPDRFPGFVAALPMNAPDEAVKEAERAVVHLGASGVQMFTNVGGCPLDQPEFFPIFQKMRELDRPVWIHPARGMKTPDYPCETYSKYELWWTLAWPYETSMAMYRLVFSGLFEKLPGIKIIVHHGGGMIPMVEERLGNGLEVYGSRTPPALEEKKNTPLKGKPLASFKQFHADVATFGSLAAAECARQFFGADRLLFASDMPFDPEEGPGYIRETIRVVNELAIPPEQKQNIFSGTIRKMCRLEPLKAGV